MLLMVHVPLLAVTNFVMCRRRRRVTRDPLRHSLGEPLLIMALDDLVALVVEHQELGDPATGTQFVDHLLGFADRHVGVVCAVDHQQRRGDVVDAVDR